MWVPELVSNVVISENIFGLPVGLSHSQCLPATTHTVVPFPWTGFPHFS